MYNFLRKLPKVELHAHLNGSLCTNSLRELAEKVHGKTTPEFAGLCAQFIKFDGSPNLCDCFQKFNFVHQLTATPLGLKYATELVIRDFAEDNVFYLELRTTPKSNLHMTRRQYLECVLQSIESAAITYPFIQVKLILSINRSESVSNADETVALALEYSKTHPRTIVGIDFSGNPSMGEFRSFVGALSLAREAGMKLALHCGEINNHKEIQEMIKFGMSRCGHGTFLTSTDIAKLKEQNVAIECCLTSNVKSGTVPSYADHHLLRLIEAKAPKVLCTDDCGVFDTTLTNEFLIAAEIFGLSQRQCVDLTIDAVQHSFATAEERANMQIRVETYFANAF